jgi:hypothetical protein
MYLLGRNFKLVTDHQPLSFLMKSPKLSGIYMRWALRLQEYMPFVIEYRVGASNANADGPSRLPLPGDGGDWEVYRDELDYYRSAPPLAAMACMLASSPLPELDTGAVEIDAVDMDEQRQQPASSTDIWDDTATLLLLFNGQEPVGSATEIHRIRQRARFYQVQQDPKLGRRLLRASDGLTVPPPHERARLVQHMHDNFGHFGVKRTLSMLKLTYWWSNMRALVEDVIKACSGCEREKAVFNMAPKQLTPLPIEGMFYRVHVDLMGPFPATAAGYTYVLLCIDAFSKWIELIPLRSKRSAEVVQAFHDGWITRWGACAQIVADQGGEFTGEKRNDFSRYCARIGLDKAAMSSYHPQSNGQVERLVRTVKSSLRRTIAAQHDAPENWLEHLQTAAMGYRMSVQGSLRLSPYFMLTGRQPVMPGHLRHVFASDIDFTDEDSVFLGLEARRKALVDLPPMAMGNLRIAQHRQSLWYLQRRDGSYRSAPEFFIPGMFAVPYVSKAGLPLSLGAADCILRVMQVRSNGAIKLQGRDGGTIVDNGAKWAPYHEQFVDATINPAVAEARYNASDLRELTCEWCGNQDAESDAINAPVMLLCEHCFTGWHLRCLNLSETPEGTWFCPWCCMYQRPETELATLYVGALSPETLMSPLQNPADVQRLLDSCMPGAPRAPTYLARLLNRAPGQPLFLQSATGLPECVVTLPHEMDSLFGILHLDVLRSMYVVDCWAGTGSIATACTRIGVGNIIQADIHPRSANVFYADSLQLSHLLALVAHLPTDFVFITSPWWIWNDVAIPLMLRCGAAAVFAHVSSTYETNPPDQRAQFFNALGDLCHTEHMVLPGAVGRQCSWLCIFRSAVDRKRLLKLTPAGATRHWNTLVSTS